MSNLQFEQFRVKSLKNSHPETDEVKWEIEEKMPPGTRKRKKRKFSKEITADRRNYSTATAFHFNLIAF